MKLKTQTDIWKFLEPQVSTLIVFTTSRVALGMLTYQNLIFPHLWNKE